MAKQNDIISKYLAPYYLGSVAFLVVGTMTGVAIDKINTFNKKSIQEGYIENADALPYILAALVILASVGMIGFGTIYLPKQAYLFADLVTDKYIEDLMKKNPDLRKYSGILDNKYTMKNITDFISNSLSESEQKEILTIVKSIGSNKEKPDYDYIAKTNEAIEKITKVINKHVKTNPHFINELFDIIKNSHNTYVMRPQQNVR